MEMKSIGEVYFDSPFFKGEEEQTIGQPIIGPNAMTIFENRRKVKGHLTTEGREKLEQFISEVKRIFKVDKVKAVWDKHCGCSMCPCSPGYRIKIEGNYRYRSSESTRFNLHVNKNGFQFFKPKDRWNIGYVEVDELEKTFSKKVE